MQPMQPKRADDPHPVKARMEERLRDLTLDLKLRARALGMKPGTQEWYSYVCGTVARARKRYGQKVTEKVTY
jgi:hypothetical protein